jgi:hypothetical protein
MSWIAPPVQRQVVKRLDADRISNVEQGMSNDEVKPTEPSTSKFDIPCSAFCGSNRLGVGWAKRSTILADFAGVGLLAGGQV